MEVFINFVKIKVIMNLVITYISAKINFIRVCVHGYDLYVSLYSWLHTVDEFVLLLSPGIANDNK